MRAALCGRQSPSPTMTPAAANRLMTCFSLTKVETKPMSTSQAHSERRRGFEHRRSRNIARPRHRHVHLRNPEQVDLCRLTETNRRICALVAPGRSSAGEAMALVNAPERQMESPSPAADRGCDRPIPDIHQRIMLQIVGFLGRIARPLGKGASHAFFGSGA